MSHAGLATQSLHLCIFNQFWVSAFPTVHWKTASLGKVESSIDPLAQSWIFIDPWAWSWIFIICEGSMNIQMLTWRHDQLAKQWYRSTFPTLLPHQPWLLTRFTSPGTHCLLWSSLKSIFKNVVGWPPRQCTLGHILPGRSVIYPAGPSAGQDHCCPSFPRSLHGSFWITFLLTSSRPATRVCGVLQWSYII